MKMLAYLGLVLCSLSMVMNGVAFISTGSLVDFFWAALMVPFIAVNIKAISEERISK